MELGLDSVIFTIMGENFTFDLPSVTKILCILCGKSNPEAK